MPYDCRVYRILIASPSDVEEEREIAVRVIQEWNDLYSYSRQVVLLPLRWETHTAPEYGIRPQEIINRTIVDQCDLLLGMFWTRIGTPTGEADSGTLEEIERVARAGKPVMLYFSKAGIDPDKLDLQQVARLKSFKDQTYPNALTESYKSPIEFRDKLAKQLELKIRDLQKADNPSQPPPLNLQFFSIESGQLSGSSVSILIDVPEIGDLDTVLNSTPTNLHRKLIEALNIESKKATTLPVVLAISNTGSSGVRNLFVEIAIRTVSGEIEVMDRYPHSNKFEFLVYNYQTWEPNEIEKKLNYLMQEKLTKDNEGWGFSFEWGAIQPQRVRLVQPFSFVLVKSAAEVEFVAKVYADNFPQPVLLKANMMIRVQAKRIRFEDIVNLELIKKGEQEIIHLITHGTTPQKQNGGEEVESERD